MGNTQLSSETTSCKKTGVRKSSILVDVCFPLQNSGDVYRYVSLPEGSVRFPEWSGTWKIQGGPLPVSKWGYNPRYPCIRPFMGG